MNDETGAPVLTDGRRQRGEDNRRRIVAAFIAFIREGKISPTAEMIAARADVGLRTVFRHFEDMERLYREIGTEIEGQVRPMVDRPFESADWQGRIEEVIERRATLFESIMPFRTAADVYRHTSPSIAARQAEFVALQRQYLEDALPASIARDPVRVEALDLVSSYEAWQRLRHEQKLSPADAKRVMAFAIHQMISGTRP